jgi:hypothetical protein
MREMASHGHAGSHAYCARSIAIRTVRNTAGSRKYRGKEHFMLDVVMLVLGLGLFALGIGYAYACERL